MATYVIVTADDYHHATSQRLSLVAVCDAQSRDRYPWAGNAIVRYR
jgi:hypothetical protein